jgi:hypothetical protein
MSYKPSLIAIAALLAHGAPSFAFAPTSDQCVVNVRYTSAERDRLLIEGQTYRLELNRIEPSLRLLGMDGAVLAEPERPLFFVDGKQVAGPGRINIYSFGTQMYEVHLRELKVEGLSADIELALYCYAKRVFVNLNVTPRDAALTPRPEIRSMTPAKAVFLEEGGDWRGLIRGAAAPAALYAPTVDAPPPLFQDAIAFLVGSDTTDLLGLVAVETHAGDFRFELDGGVFEGYRPTRGFYEITMAYSGPRSFEEGWINPNQRYEISLRVSPPTYTIPDLPQPAEVICNIRNTYGVLEASMATDPDGFPLPVQVQVCKNFGGEKEEGPEEGDIPYGESYVPISVGPAPFEGRVYHLFGNWGTHPLKQISSIRFFHHYFHASLGPTETLCYVPFEFPRPDDRDYILADVRGLSNFYWRDQPQHDHVSVVGALRYKSEGKWVNNLLQDTRIYLTAPNLASFALEYLSEDGRVKTNLEIFEAPEDDETRCFVKMTVDVLDTVPIDGNSAHNLRFLNAGAYIVHTRWPHVAYTDADNQTRIVDVPDNDRWALEGVPMGSEWPFAAAYPHKNGNMCFFVNRFEGRLGGHDVQSFGLSCFGGKEWTELFLTAPGQLAQLEKGDRIEAHLFVMPYGHAGVDHGPAERQRELYGANLTKTRMIHGTVEPGYPPRIHVGDGGYAEFVLEGGNNWRPFLVEGLTSHRGVMLWEKRGGEWLFHDQQIRGNDWYQTYRASDGSVGAVLVTKVRMGQGHHYLVTAEPHARAITQRNGFVTIEGGPMDFVSPVRFKELTCAPMDGTDLYRCSGNVNEAHAE